MANQLAGSWHYERERRPLSGGGHHNTQRGYNTAEVIACRKGEKGDIDRVSEKCDLRASYQVHVVKRKFGDDLVCVIRLIISCAVDIANIQLHGATM